MKTAFLCLYFLPLTVSAVTLRLEPDFDQFFSSETIKLICEGQTGGWSVKRMTRDNTGQTCGRGLEDFGQIEISFCVVSTASPSDSGSYWCQDGTGTKSQEVHLTVTDGDLILDSPVLPVETGSDVSLHCRVRAGFGVKPEIFRNSSLFQPHQNWTIFNVSRSDQGFYSCSGLKSGLKVTSEERWLRVKDPCTTPPPTTSLSPTSSSLSPTDSSSDSSQNKVSVLVQVGAAVGCLALLVLVLVLVLLRRQRQTGSGGPDAEAADVTYADVTVRRADRPAPAPEEDTVYSGVRTHAAEVTYGQVVVKPKKKKKRTETIEPWADPDVVYSSVRVRNSAGT